MLLFDNERPFNHDPLKELTEHNVPDVIEIGETNDYWLQVRRSTKKIEVLSKQTGHVIARCEVSEAAIQYGLSRQQVDAAQRGLVL